jgi:hypothetical protein
MSRHLDPPKPGSEQREEQGGDRRGWGGGEDQGACAERAVECAERDDGVRGGVGIEW